MTKQNGFSAWLITWEWSGDHAEPQKKVMEVLNPRMSPNRVREIVEQLYHIEASLSEKVAWRLCKREQCYPAEFVAIEGVRWEGQITCGHNPWLMARLVDNFVIEIDEDLNEAAPWIDRNPVREMTDKLRRLHNRDQES